MRCVLGYPRDSGRTGACFSRHHPALGGVFSEQAYEISDGPKRPHSDHTLQCYPVVCAVATFTYGNGDAVPGGGGDDSRDAGFYRGVVRNELDFCDFPREV